MLKKFLTSLFLLLTLTISVSFAQSGEVYTITSYGEGQVAAAPDMASIVFSVKNNASDAKTAQENNAKAANNVISAIKSQGVDSKDIKTSNYSVYPVYDNNSRRITGYSADNSITVKIRNINKVGEIVDKALSFGANQVTSINFGISDTKNMEKQALILAIKNAKEQAEIIANSLNLSIVGVKHVNPSVRHQSFDASPMLMKSAARLENSSTPVESGEVSVKASVNVEFIIK